MTDITTTEFWAGAISAANRSEKMRTKTTHFEAAVIALEIGDSKQHIEMHRGVVMLLDAAPLSGATLRLSGPREEWQRLMSGSIPYVKAVNPYHGKIILAGNVLLGTWALPALSELFRITADLMRTTA